MTLVDTECMIGRSYEALFQSHAPGSQFRLGIRCCPTKLERLAACTEFGLTETEDVVSKQYKNSENPHPFERTKHQKCSNHQIATASHIFRTTSMKVSTVLAATLFVVSANILPRLASALSPEHDNHPRDFERRQTHYCNRQADWKCVSGDYPCCVDAQHGSYCNNGMVVVYEAPGGCVGTSDDQAITVSFYNSNY
jgi:hypothetical protein